MNNGDDVMLKRGGVGNMPVSLTLDHVSPVTRLLEKRKQMLEVQKALDNQKDEYLRKEELFKRREENLRKKDLELQEALVLFNKFLKENEHKRRRADHRANEEQKKTQRWMKEIKDQKKSLKNLREKCEQKKREHKMNHKYHQYLQDTLESNGTHFDEIQSIITRHSTLEDAYSDLIQKQKDATSENEKLGESFRKFYKDQYNKTLSLNNDIARFSKELEGAVKQTGDIEEQIIAEERLESVHKRDATQIIMAVDNVYNRCRKVVNSVIKHGVKRLSAKEKEGMDSMDIKKEETCLKLDVIANYLNDFRDMVVAVGSTNPQILAAARGGNKSWYSSHVGGNGMPPSPSRS